ncbi:MAG: NAD(+) diphosphatase [Marinobacter sp.]|uniref:NAD(+) diphosphatase n=1 Tax=Marinobacter sp. TaxID=50741 RepID=UPI00299EE374|nr:NAD(+) diphosphatase [Marinobacter sp.]MDX1634070.1 NAD(+) diphosphatase [Marinobacter sp.]
MTQWAAGWRREGPSVEDGVVALCDQAVVSRNGQWLLPWSEAGNWLDGDSEPVYVGRFEGRNVYVAEMSADAPFSASERVPLRDAVLTTASATAAMLSTAIQVQQGWRDHRYCGRCGRATGYHPAERARWCEHCRIPWYARLAPCVIVVIRRGDRFLLARSSRTRRYYYSLIAGFVEPGESAEEAVIREVLEETGLEVTNVRYRASQPWPFPHQLMLGYFADYAGGDLVLQEDELADAGWFEPGALPPVPPDTTIAGRLIQAMEREIAAQEGLG